MDSRLPTSLRSNRALGRLARGLLFGALIAGGCAHGQADPPSSAPQPQHQAAHQQAAHEHEEPAPHLRAVADATEASQPAGDGLPAISAPPTADVTLGSLLDYADVHSPVLTVARSTRSRADAMRVAASPLLPANPTLTVSVGPRFAAGSVGVGVDAALMQQIEIAGERGRRLAAADRAHELTDAEIEELRWLVHCEVHAAFHRALIERERARLSAQVVTFQREVLLVVERQIAAGETAPLALRLAQAEVAQAEQLQVLAEQGFVASRMRLGQLSGWPASAPPSPSGGLDAPREPPTLEQLVTVARRELPSLRRGQAAVSEASARVAVADREAFIKPSVGLQYSREDNGNAGPVVDVLQGVITLPLPAFQRNDGARALARSDVTVAQAELLAERSLIEARINAARSEVVSAAQRTRAYGDEILPKLQENLVLLRRALELGELDILALSVGRERFLRIQSDALSAQLDYFVALAELERVVGVDLWHDDQHGTEHGAKAHPHAHGSEGTP